MTLTTIFSPIESVELSRETYAISAWILFMQVSWNEKWKKFGCITRIARFRRHHYPTIWWITRRHIIPVSAISLYRKCILPVMCGNCIHRRTFIIPFHDWTIRRKVANMLIDDGARRYRWWAHIKRRQTLSRPLFLDYNAMMIIAIAFSPWHEYTQYSLGSKGNEIRISVPLAVVHSCPYRLRHKRCRRERPKRTVIPLPSASL